MHLPLCLLVGRDLLLESEGRRLRWQHREARHCRDDLPLDHGQGLDGWLELRPIRPATDEPVLIEECEQLALAPEQGGENADRRGNRGGIDRRQLADLVCDGNPVHWRTAGAQRLG